MMSFFEIHVKVTFYIQLLIRTNDQYQTDKKNFKKVFLIILQKNFLRISLDQNDEQISYEICFQKIKNQDEKLEDFDVKKITSIFNEVFTAE